MQWLDQLNSRVYGYLSNEDLWINIGSTVLKLIAIVIIAGIVIKVGKVFIHNLFKVRAKGPLQLTERREATLLKLLDNILTYVVYFVAIIMILEAMDFEIRALLAGAGIVGLAVGFGAQNLVRDIITGFFIIFDRNLAFRSF